MDSGNSGSLQSSSSGDGGGGGASVAPSTRFNSIPIIQPPSNFFNPSSFSQPLNTNPNPNPNSMYNLDSLWSGNSNPNPVYDPYLNPNPVDPHSGPEKLGITTKNPKKRTRASRRAPTTVLTTDTTNFRQMVQEFTGIPAAPFSASPSSSAFSRRLDIYGGGVAPMHPLRPSAQKIQLQQPPYLNSARSNFPITPSESNVFTKQTLNLSNLQNQMFSFQSVPQINVLPRENENENNRSEPPSEYMSSSSASLKRWRGQDENLMNFEGVNGNGNNQNGVVSSRSEGDQLIPGNDDDSWSF